MEKTPALRAFPKALPSAIHLKANSVMGAIESLIAEAYQQGFYAGSAAMRESILRAAQGSADSIPVPDAPQHGVRVGFPREEAKEPLPKGTLRPLVTKILIEQPGMTVAQVQAKAMEIDGRMSPLSIGNELQRNKNKFYLSENGKWKVIHKPPADSGFTSSPKGETGAQNPGLFNQQVDELRTVSDGQAGGT